VSGSPPKPVTEFWRGDLDLHMRYVHGCRLVPGAPDGQQERHFRFPNTLQDWSRFAQSLDQDCQVALEVTGGAFEIFDLLCPSHAGKILLASPTELRRLGSGRHTDHVDARRLARMHNTVPLGEFYRRNAKRIGHNKAIIALARKLLIVAWRRLLTGEAYRAVNPKALARRQ